MPLFQDDFDPIVDSNGVILFERFGFEHIAQSERFTRLERTEQQISNGFVVGRAYHLIEDIVSPAYYHRGGTILLPSEADHPEAPTGPLAAPVDLQAWSSSTYRHCFYILIAARVDSYGSRSGSTLTQILTFMNSRSGDMYAFSLGAAVKAFVSVPKMVAVSKIQDVRTKVSPDSTVTRKVRSIQYRSGFLFCFRSISPQLRQRVYENFNCYLGRIDSTFFIPEERAARDMPASNAERTEVPTPEPDSEAPPPDLDEDTPDTPLPSRSESEALIEASRRAMQQQLHAQIHGLVRSDRTPAPQTPPPNSIWGSTRTQRVFMTDDSYFTQAPAATYRNYNSAINASQPDNL